MTINSWNLKLISAALAFSLASSPTFAQEPNSDVPAEGDPEESSTDQDEQDSSELGAESGEASSSAESANESPEEAAAPPQLDGATYRVRLRDLEQRVDELKEQIRRSHTRLSLLSDTILSGGSGGARAEIEFVNDLSGAWHLVEAVFVMDGAVQYKKTDDTGVLAEQKTIPIFSGSVPTGDHTLQVMLKLRGHGFGVFSYLRGMEASLKADHSFTLTDGKVLELRATAWEQGGPTTPVEEQPDIRFNQTIRNAGDVPKAMPAKKSAPEAKASGETSSGGGKVGASLGGSSTTEAK